MARACPRSCRATAMQPIATAATINAPAAIVCKPVKSAATESSPQTSAARGNHSGSGGRVPDHGDAADTRWRSMPHCGQVGWLQVVVSVMGCALRWCRVRNRALKGSGKIAVVCDAADASARLRPACAAVQAVPTCEIDQGQRSADCRRGLNPWPSARQRDGDQHDGECRWGGKHEDAPLRSRMKKVCPVRVHAEFSDKVVPVMA